MDTQLDLNDLRLFVHVIENRGLMRTAQQLNLPQSSVSRRIATLEKNLGVRLLDRGAKQFSVTDVGRELYQYGVGMMEAAIAAETYLQRKDIEPAGRIRLRTSAALAHVVLPPLLQAFSVECPKVRLSVDVTHDTAHAGTDGFDLFLCEHGEALPDSNFIQQWTGPVPMCTVATPEYLKRARTLDKPADLVVLDLLTCDVQQSEVRWDFTNTAGQREGLVFSPRMECADLVTLRQATLSHLGVARLPAYLCVPHLNAGTLTEVLPGWQAPRKAVTLLSASRRVASAGVRSLVSVLTTQLAGAIAPVTPDQTLQ